MSPRCHRGPSPKPRSLWLPIVFVGAGRMSNNISLSYLHRSIACRVAPIVRTGRRSRTAALASRQSGELSLATEGAAVTREGDSRVGRRPLVRKSCGAAYVAVVGAGADCGGSAMGGGSQIGEHRAGQTRHSSQATAFAPACCASLAHRCPVRHGRFGWRQGCDRRRCLIANMFSRVSARWLV